VENCHLNGFGQVLHFSSEYITLPKAQPRGLTEGGTGVTDPFCPDSLKSGATCLGGRRGSDIEKRLQSWMKEVKIIF
jgi:hypothetical protein